MSTQSPNPVDLAIRSVAGATGSVLALVFAATARLRRDKPLHPVGTVSPARLTITPRSTPSGSALLDEPAAYDCLVRASHAVGTGPEHLDIEGFALRVLPGRRHPRPIDVLFASTGSGPRSRFSLVPRRSGVHGTLTTLLPVRAAGHPLVLRLEPSDPESDPWPRRYELGWAHGGGPWQRCGTVTVDWDGAEDEPERFDPVTNPLPGASQYPAVRWLREPSYALARRAWPRAGRLPRR